MRRRTQTINHARRSAGTRRGYRQPLRQGAATTLAPTRSTGTRTLLRPRPEATPDPVALGAVTWFACGIVLLGLTPLPLRNAHLGWSFTFWALAAPLLVLLARCLHAGSRSRLR